ncbi:response regulator [Mucilaginibacter sp. Bleaf8]|uniref:response regulator n=1 Tax=Mucilaginibacter sp. Bleaf8 TaxID=2834430 RepID=UPI001BCD03D4|nr:response regulator [Mucilaginibacter sp. Bleaf8]MBS7565956.1 response regulator [Mucilaginibacter sp. Bleaf8]
MCKLVMIDDNPLEHLIIQKMCERYALFEDAVHLYDGRTMLNMLGNNEEESSQIPDVILLDLNMPSFSGWEFLHGFDAISAKLKKPISVYILSSSIDQVEKAKTQSYPFVKDFISKPIKKETLKSLFDKHTDVA